MAGNIHLGVLDRVQIASPCDVAWEDMVGDDRVRRCAQCDLNVHNIAAMTRREAEALLAPVLSGEGGRVCAQLYRREDGTIITSDCPVGLARLRQRAAHGARRAVALTALAVCGVMAMALQAMGQRTERLTAREPFATLRGWLNPTLPVPMPMRGRVFRTGGIMCAPTPPSSAGAGGQGSAGGAR